jgi:ABC-type multidrug transport system ATPase subunit
MEMLQQQEEMVIEDEDIVEEAEKVARSRPEDNTVRLHKVKKYYGKTLAVENVSFGLEYGECFALLGVSGAGKTTTFKCLIGEETPSAGEVSVNGFDLTTRNGFENARKLIGYCPQFDAIFDGMTVREHLEFYANVKGILR